MDVNNWQCIFKSCTSRWRRVVLSIMPLITVNEEGHVLYYEDSGAPPALDGLYTTLMIVHGTSFHSRGYPSMKFTSFKPDAEIDSLFLQRYSDDSCHSLQSTISVSYSSTGATIPDHLRTQKRTYRRSGQTVQKRMLSLVKIEPKSSLGSSRLSWNKRTYRRPRLIGNMVV